MKYYVAWIAGHKDHKIFKACEEVCGQKDSRQQWSESGGDERRGRRRRWYGGDRRGAYKPKALQNSQRKSLLDQEPIMAHNTFL